MKPAAPGSVVFSGEELLPDVWRRAGAAGPVRAFNPALLSDGDGWLFAYRVVMADGLRRIGVCRLDAQLGIVAGSAVAWSDAVRFRGGVDYPEIATRWFADPRLYRFGGRLFLYWNSGWHEPRNYQFVQELDPLSLLPRGHPRELLLRGERQKLEKNWVFFASPREDGGERLFAVYSILPHRVLEFSLEGGGDIVFEEVARVDWQLRDYPSSHGGLRGGAPPCLRDGRWWVFCHSVHDGPDGYRYVPAVYCFAAKHPFAPVAQPRRPLAFGDAFGNRRSHARLNPAVGEVIYPCGAAHDGTRWWVSHGINDEYCAVSAVTDDDVRATLEPLPPSAT